MTHRRREPSDELMQRISAALDAEGGVEADAELRALLDREPDALLYAQDLVRIDEVLADLGRRAAEPDWDALAARIEAELDRDAPQEALEGFDLPPRFLDADARDEGVTREVPLTPASAPRREAQPEPPKVVELASRRRKTLFAWTGGLAAAAAVGLGVAFGTSFDADSSSAPMASEPMAYDEAAESAPSPQAMAPMVAPSPAEGAWDVAEGEAVAEPAAELPAAAAAVAQPAFGRERRAAREASRAAPPPPPAPMRRGEPPALDHAGGGALPGRTEMISRLRDVEPAVQRCLARVGEVARVTLRVGVAGDVVSARVAPPYTGADATCIVDALRAARLPPSSEPYDFVYAFRPAPVAGGSLAPRPNASRAARGRAPARPAAQTEVSDPFQ